MPFTLPSERECKKTVLWSLHSRPWKHAHFQQHDVGRTLNHGPHSLVGLRPLRLHHQPSLTCKTTTTTTSTSTRNMKQPLLEQTNDLMPKWWRNTTFTQEITRNVTLNTGMRVLMESLLPRTRTELRILWVLAAKDLHPAPFASHQLQLAVFR